MSNCKQFVLDEHHGETWFYPPHAPDCRTIAMIIGEAREKRGLEVCEEDVWEYYRACWRSESIGGWYYDEHGKLVSDIEAVGDVCRQFSHDVRVRYNGQWFDMIALSCWHDWQQGWAKCAAKIMRTVTGYRFLDLSDTSLSRRHEHSNRLGHAFHPPFWPHAEPEHYHLMEKRLGLGPAYQQPRIVCLREYLRVARECGVRSLRCARCHKSERKWAYNPHTELSGALAVVRAFGRTKYLKVCSYDCAVKLQTQFQKEVSCLKKSETILKNLRKHLRGHRTAPPSQSGVSTPAATSSASVQP